MRWIPMDSTQLKKMAYDEKTQTLLVQFNNGTVYMYENVEADEAAGVMFDEDSQGRAFNARIKSGGYSFSKLSSEEAELVGA